jgi:hypothetical protein
MLIQVPVLRPWLCRQQMSAALPDPYERSFAISVAGYCKHIAPISQAHLHDMPGLSLKQNLFRCLYSYNVCHTCVHETCCVVTC